MHDMADSSAEIMRKGSSTFSLAALFFGRDLREGAAKVYHWCRYIDDAIDVEGKDVRRLRDETLRIWDRDQVFGAPMVAFQQVVQKYEIPRQYPLDLLRGMEMDTVGVSFDRMEELEDYCYCVAGTVGLMMCHLTGLYRQGAMQNAVALGKAMQLTNICRDIQEDHQRGRLYLPLELLRKKGLCPKTYMLAENRSALFQIIRKVVEISEDYYELGRQGLIDLPLRAAFAVNAAALMYREIGREILRKGEESLERRTVVSRGRKLWLAVLAIGEVLGTIPYRIGRRKSLEKIEIIWSHS